MITCPNCKKNFIDGTRFCTVCGGNLEEMIKAEALKKEQPMEKIKALPKKMWAIWGGIAVAVIVVIAVVFSMLNVVSKDKYVVYFKDGELYLDMLNIQGPFAITDGLSEDVGAEVALVHKDYYLNRLTAISNDGKMIFYPTNMKKNFKLDLYYRSTSKSGAEGEKIAETVYGYKVSPEGDFLIYHNDEGLFLYDFEDKEKIEESISSYRISEDCSIIYYVTDDNSLYCWKKGRGAHLMAEASNPLYISEDFSTVYYSDNKGIYVSKDGKEGVLISDMAQYLQAYENGTMYYTKYETDTYHMSDYVVDDYIELDAEISHFAPPDYYTYPWPEKPVNPTLEELEAYEEAYAKAYAQYKAEMDAYLEQEKTVLEKENRDAIRKKIAEQTYVVSRYALYYYDGEKSIKLADDVTAGMFGQYAYSASEADAAPALYVEINMREDVGTIRLSEIEDISNEISNWTANLQHAVSQPMIFAKEKGDVFVKASLSDMVFSKDGSKAYVVTGLDRVLGEMNLDGDSWEFREYDTNVYPVAEYIIPLEDGGLMYFKDMQTQDVIHMQATLCISQEEIEKDVLYGVYEIDAEGNIYFFRDCDTTEGELCCYKDGEVIEIDKDVYLKDFRVSEEGGVFYLKEYDEEESLGKLYYSVNGEVGQLIDKEVAGIVRP